MKYNRFLVFVLSLVAAQSASVLSISYIYYFDGDVPFIGKTSDLACKRVWTEAEVADVESDLYEPGRFSFMPKKKKSGEYFVQESWSKDIRFIGDPYPVLDRESAYRAKLDFDASGICVCPQMEGTTKTFVLVEAGDDAPEASDFVFASLKGEANARFAEISRKIAGAPEPLYFENLVTLLPLADRPGYFTTADIRAEALKLRAALGEDYENGARDYQLKQLAKDEASCRRFLAKSEAEGRTDDAEALRRVLAEYVDARRRTVESVRISHEWDTKYPQLFGVVGK